VKMVFYFENKQQIETFKQPNDDKTQI